MNLNAGLNIIDLSVIIFLSIGGIIGLIRGFIREISGILSLAATIYIIYLSNYIGNYVQHDITIVVTIFYIIFGVIIYSIIKTIIEYIFIGIENIIIIKTINRILGIIIGIVKVYLLICIGTCIYFNSISSDKISTELIEAKSMQYVIPTIDFMDTEYGKFNNNIFKIPEKIKEYYKKQSSIYYVEELSL